MPAADNGFPNPRALTHLLCRAFHRLGVAPQVPMRTDYTLVDRVAETLTEAVRDPSAWRETYHVFDPHVVCLGDVPGLAGRPIRRVAADEFVAALRAAAAGDARLAMLSALLHQRSSRPPEMFDGLLDENPALFAQERYRHAAARWRLAAPAVGTAINAYGQFLVAEPADGPGD
jgi:hypothetical protein